MIGLTVICDWDGVVDENMCNVAESGFCRRGKFVSQDKVLSLGL